jgi:hypothetical protein
MWVWAWVGVLVQVVQGTNRFGAGGASAGDYPAYEERTPYPAFTRPNPQPHEMYDQGGGAPGLRCRREPGS